jgi:hypothetical protein
MIYSNRGRDEIVTAIIYRQRNKKGDLLPMDVFTSTWVDRSKLGPGYPPSSFSTSVYDFDWCERDQTLYQHKSGGGGENFYIHPSGEPAKPPRCAVWWNREIVKPTNGRIRTSFLGERYLRRIGYDVLTEPLPVLGGSENPFSDACDGDVEYCSRCNDHLPTDNLCDHIWYCEKCGVYSTPSERCKHRPAK